MNKILFNHLNRENSELLSAVKETLTKFVCSYEGKRFLLPSDKIDDAYTFADGGKEWVFVGLCMDDCTGIERLSLIGRYVRGGERIVTAYYNTSDLLNVLSCLNTLLYTDED